MNELITIEKTKIPDVFKASGLDPYIQIVREKVTGIVPDVSTDKGRKEIASLAFTVAKSKTYLDALGKDLVSKIKEQTKAIDSERKRMRDTLDELRNEIRKPLNEWEASEEDRKSSHMKNIAKITIDDYSMFSTVDGIIEEIKAVENTPIDESWEEYITLAAQTKDKSLEFLRNKLVEVEQQEKEKAELDRLRLEAKERAQKDRDEKIAREAAELELANAATAIAAEKLKAEAAIQATKQAEINAAAAVLKAESDAVEAARQAETDKQAAIVAERERTEQLKRNEIAAELKRKQDKDHLRDINTDVKGAIEKLGAAPELAKLIVIALAMGNIPHTKIQY